MGFAPLPDLDDHFQRKLERPFRVRLIIDNAVDLDIEAIEQGEDVVADLFKLTGFRRSAELKAFLA